MSTGTGRVQKSHIAHLKRKILLSVKGRHDYVAVYRFCHRLFFVIVVGVRGNFGVFHVLALEVFDDEMCIIRL